MQVILDKNKAPAEFDSNSFCAAFVHQDSYIELLRQCDTNFNLHLLSREKRELELRNPAYMLISVSKTTMKQISVGTKVNMKITELVYSKPLKLIVAKVYLKKNFTCAEVPHIIIAKDGNMPNQIATGVLSGSFDHMGDTYRIPYYQPLSISGKLGLMLGSSQENYDRAAIDRQESSKPEPEPPVRERPAERRVKSNLPDPIFTPTKPTQFEQSAPRANENIQLDKFFMTNPTETRNRLIEELRQSTMDQKDGTKITIQQTHQEVTRPEATEIIERPPPSIMKISLNEVKNTYKTDDHDAEPDDSITETQELHKGCIIMKGPRGGKYIIKNSKKIYLKDEDSGSGEPTGNAPVFRSNVVYKVNLLKT